MLKNILSRMVLETTYVAKFASMTTVAAIAVVLFAQPAHAQDLPPSPTGQCKFNWNIWTSAITQAQTLVPESENPMTYGGTKINTSLGTDMWYSPPGGEPNFAYTEVNDGGKPADIPSFTTEFIYGIGRFVSIPNESRTVTITDSGAYEGHALAVFDAGGHQIARYPDAATVTNQGKYYIKSGGNGGPDAEGVQKPGSWSDTFTFTVPADGEYYLHYIIIDSGYAYNSITSSLCKTTPFSATDDSFGPISAGIGASTTNVVANDELNNVANPDIGTEVMDVSINSGGNATDGSVLGLDITPTLGSITMDRGTGQIVVAPNTTPGNYVFTYEICEVLNPENCATARATLDIVVQPIVATNDTVENSVLGTSTTVSALANDTDAEGARDAGEVTLTTTGKPANAVLSGDGKTLTVPGEGEWSVDAGTGNVTFTPAAGYDGDPTVYYTVSDIFGNASNEASITIDYGDRPVVVDDTLENTSATIAAVTFDPEPNHTDADGSLDVTTVVLAGTGAPADAVLSVDGKTLTVPGEGEWSVDANTGEITFTPEDGFAGDPTPATYTIADNDGNVSAEASLAIDYGDRPVAVADSHFSPMAVGVTVDPLINDSDTDGSLDATTVVLTKTGASADASLSVDGKTLIVPCEGEWRVDPATGAISFAPESGVTNDPTPASYRVSDNTGNASNEAILTVEYGDGLIAPIKEDLKTILTQDLTNTLIQQSTQIGSYSSDALSRVQNMSQNGCLLAVRKTLEQTKILFDVGGAEIKPESQGVLDDLASVSASCPNTGFEIAGHTDSDASDAYNLALSQGRATAVINALKARGVDTSGFIAHGYGEANPIASNSTPDGKKQNRRIEVRVLGPDGSDAGCESSYELDRSFNAAVDEEGASMDGTFIQDNFDCQSQRRSLVEGAISYTDTDGGLEQSAMTLSYRREQYRNGNSVFGYFGGIYGTQSDVKERATGDIQGVGVNAGIYGVDRLNSGLYLDYHLAGAMARSTVKANTNIWLLLQVLQFPVV